VHNVRYLSRGTSCPQARRRDTLPSGHCPAQCKCPGKCQDANSAWRTATSGGHDAVSSLLFQGSLGHPALTETRPFDSPLPTLAPKWHHRGIPSRSTTSHPMMKCIAPCEQEQEQEQEHDTTGRRPLRPPSDTRPPVMLVAGRAQSPPPLVSSISDELQVTASHPAISIRIRISISISKAPTWKRHQHSSASSAGAVTPPTPPPPTPGSGYARRGGTPSRLDPWSP